MKKLKYIIGILVLTGFFPVFGEEAQEEAKAEPSAKEEKSHDHHAFHSNHLAVFLGATTFSKDETKFTAGADYEYRLSAMHGLLGLGLIADFAFREHVQSIFGGGLFIHPAGGLKILLAPGAEIHDGHAIFLFRGGIAYDIHAGSLSITPTINFDYANHHLAYVYGLGIGVGF
ncbi:MAG: hypothetical protein OEZ22_10460 [Spirochaetia bacterium]|nr:hypothetical protein [Spirochaetia bacterium]